MWGDTLKAVDEEVISLHSFHLIPRQGLKRNASEAHEDQPFRLRDTQPRAELLPLGLGRLGDWADVDHLPDPSQRKPWGDPQGHVSVCIGALDRSHDVLMRR